MTAWYDPVVVCERHWRKGTEAKRMPGTTTTWQGWKNGIFLSVQSLCPAAQGAAGAGTPGQKHQGALIDLCPCLGKIRPRVTRSRRNRKNRLTHSPGVLPGAWTLCLLRHIQASLWSCRDSARDRKAFTKSACLQKPVPRNLNWALTRGARSKQAVPVQSVL